MEAERARAAAHLDEQIGDTCAVLAIRGVEGLDVHFGVVDDHHHRVSGGQRTASRAREGHDDGVFKGTGGGVCWGEVGGGGCARDLA